MLARRAQQRGQATVEHVGMVVLVVTLLVVVTSVMARSLHPSAAPPELVGRIAHQLAAPLAGGASPSSAQEGWDPGAAQWPRPADELLQPFWIGMDLHHHEAPIGRWLGAAKDAVVDNLPGMAAGCLKMMVGVSTAPASGAASRSEMARGGGSRVGRAAKFLLKRQVVVSCLAGAAGSLFSR
jgi:hypothetical protein